MQARRRRRAMAAPALPAARPATAPRAAPWPPARLPRAAQPARVPGRRRRRARRGRLPASPPQCGRARHTENADGADQVVRSRGGSGREERRRVAELRVPGPKEQGPSQAAWLAEHLSPFGPGQWRRGTQWGKRSVLVPEPRRRSGQRRQRAWEQRAGWGRMRLSVSVSLSKDFLTH